MTCLARDRMAAFFPTRALACPAHFHARPATFCIGPSRALYKGHRPVKPRASPGSHGLPPATPPAKEIVHAEEIAEDVSESLENRGIKSLPAGHPTQTRMAEAIVGAA